MNKSFTYWISDREDDHHCYSIRKKKLKEVIKELKDMKLEKQKDGSWVKHYCGGSTIFAKPRKHTLHYIDTMDLVDLCLGEGHGYNG